MERKYYDDEVRDRRLKEMHRKTEFIFVTILYIFAAYLLWMVLKI
jgi:hypothetical protein